MFNFSSTRSSKLKLLNSEGPDVPKINLYQIKRLRSHCIGYRMWLCHIIYIVCATLMIVKSCMLFCRSYICAIMTEIRTTDTSNHAPEFSLKSRTKGIMRRFCKRNGSSGDYN